MPFKIPILIANQRDIEGVVFSLDVLLDLARKNPEKYYVEDGKLYMYDQPRLSGKRLFISPEVNDE